ncbi:hypothetical protein [Rhodovulum adriaticum]|uniref:hypothetical protein n=1 Tax=Rhodovulum adriaticum TaxID=35804 RepID=UPI001905DBB7|nr:hypothetical protein [Rhodovulum adriaticum]MBK1637333.1 hypothetical protein [Rhodovulum adriaticum]
MKKPGRPKRDTEAVTIRFHRDTLAAIDALCEQAPDCPTRPEMIRRMVNQVLEMDRKDNEGSA